MSSLTQQQAQRQVDDIQAFRRELARLEQSSGLELTTEQKARIDDSQRNLLAQFRNHFDIDRNERDRHLSLGMKAASLIGALALAASVFFLFYQFWGYFGATVQVIFLAGGSLASLLLTLIVRQRDASGYFARLAAILAVACFVLNLVMLGQIFNIRPSPHALAFWALYGGILAYAVQSRLLLAAALTCALAYFSLLLGSLTGAYWMAVMQRPETCLPMALVIFTIPFWISQARFDGFAAIYRCIGLLGLFVTLLLLACWGGYSYLQWRDESVEHLYQWLGFIVSALVIWLGIRRNWTETVNIGLLFFIVFLYVKFFDWWWDYLPKYLFFFILGLAAIVVLLLLRRFRRWQGGEQ